MNFKTNVLMLAVFTAAYGACADVVTQSLTDGGTALVVSGTEFTDDEVAALNGNEVTELWKTGASTLQASGIASFTGTIRVKGGVYKMSELSGWGSTAGKLYVESGATLYTTVGTAAKEVHIAGTGSGSYPALVKGSVAMALVMDDDATIAFLGNWISVATTLDMGGHTLTIGYCGENGDQRSEGVWPVAANITNPGHIVIDGAIDAKKVCRLTFTYGSDQLQGTNHTLTVRNGELDWYLAKKKSNWTLIFENNGKVGQNSNASNFNYDFAWDGPIEVKSGATLNICPNGGRRLDINGPISGEGAITLMPDYSGDVYFNGTNTAFTGKLKISRGNLFVTSDSGLTAAQAAVATYGSTAAVILQSRGETYPDGFTAATVKDIIESKPAGSISVGVGEGEIFDYPYAMPGDFTGFLASYGLGVVRVNAEMDSSNSLRLSAVTNMLVTAGDEAATRVSSPTNITISRGRVTMADAGTFSLSADLGNTVTVAGNLPPYPELIITGKTVIAQAPDADNPVTFTVANDGGLYGRLEFQDGAFSTNNFSANAGTYAQSLSTQEIIQRRGSSVKWTRKSNDVYFGGAFASTSYVLDGGELVSDKWLHMSGNAKKSTSITMFRLMDGVFRKIGNELHLGWGGGTTILYQTGGRYEQEVSGAAMRLVSTSWNSSVANGGYALLAIDGGRARSIHKSPIIMSEASNCVSHVALREGAVLTAPAILRQNRQPQNYYWLFEESENRAYLHFDGGVFQANSGGQAIFGTNAVETAEANYRTGLDKVAVYEGGAIIDSSNLNVTVSVPLEKPQGLGVKAITLPAGYDAEDWFGGINVQILGEGEGATAVALYDSVNHRLTGVKVISSGWGYQEGTTTALVSMGGKTDAIECAVTLGETIDGGLVKRGTGTLQLRAVNTFTGPVRVEAGTLSLQYDGTLPYSAPLMVLEGATLNAPGKTFTPETFTCAGTVKADVVVAAGAKLGLGAAGGTVDGTLTIADGAVLEVTDVVDEKRHALVSATSLNVDITKIAVNMADGQLRPQRWMLDRSGNALSLLCSKGMHIYLR